MSIKQLVYILSFVFCFFSLSSQASSPVWKVSKGKDYLYLGATIHMLGKQDYPLPPAFDIAYKDSSRLVFEADLKKLQSPEFSKIFMENLLYPGNKTIKDVLDITTFNALDNHFVSRGLPLEQMLKFKPGMLSMMMTVFELKRLNIAGMGVDEFYINKGLSEGKKFAYLEKIEDQLSFLADMGKTNENEFILYTLRDLEKISGQMTGIKEAWRTGDNSKLEKAALTGWEKEFPEIYNTLLLERNNKWIPKIESMLKTKEVEFIMFGALHMVGDDGVLAQLRKRGYTVHKQ